MTISEPVADLPFPPRPTRAGLVASSAAVLGDIPRHQFRRGATGFQQRCHVRHGRGDVVEEGLVATAQVVEPTLAVRGAGETVLRATAVTGEPHITVQAVLRKGFPLVSSERLLLGKHDQVDQPVFADVAEFVLGLDEVIARIQVTGVLQSDCEAAGLGMHAEAGWFAVPIGQCDVEHLHIDGSDVPAFPFLEDIDQEPGEAVGRDRAVGDQVSVLDIQWPVPHPFAPADAGHRQQCLGGPLHDRDELQVLRAAFAGQEPVDLPAGVLVGGVHCRESVPFDAVPLQRVQPGHHLVEAATAGLVDPVGVVDLPRPVDRKSHQEAVFGEERCPFVVDERAIGLNGVDQSLTGQRHRLRELHGTAEEVQAHHGRLAALPPDDHLGRVDVGPDQLPQVDLQQVIGHPESAPRIQHFLGQEEAIGAIEIANRPGRLRQEVEHTRRPGRDPAR